MNDLEQTMLMSLAKKLDDLVAVVNSIQVDVATVKETTKVSDARLAKVNGTVARNVLEIAELKASAALKVASDEATAKANAKVTAKYERYLAPLRKYALAFAVGYVLAHGPQILAFSKSLFEVSK